MDELLELYNNSELNQVLQDEFRKIVLRNTNDTHEIARIWERFPMAPWALADNTFIEQLQNLNALQMIRAFTDNNKIITPKRIFNYNSTNVLAKTENKIVQVIHMPFDEYSIAILLLQNFLDNLVLVPDIANTSAAVFRVYNLVTTLLQAIQNVPLKERILTILTENMDGRLRVNRFQVI